VGAVLVALVCLAVGAGVGRWLPARKPAGDQTWTDVDELTQMSLVPGGYNFVESNKSYENHLIDLIHDRLVRFDPVQNQLVPALARTWDVSPDGLTWTFRLRPAHTPDGTPLTADDVVFSFNLCLDPRFDCKKRGNFVVKGKPVVAAAADPLTVTFTLPEPFHSFPFAVAPVFVVPKGVFAPVAGSEQDFRKAVGVQQPEAKYLRGFGPYAVEAQDTQEVRLARNDKFWGRGDDHDPKPHVRQVTLALRKEDALRELDFLNDDRFAYRLVGAGEAGRLRADPRFQVLDRGVSGWCMFFWVNQNPAAPWGKAHPRKLELFQKVEFRRALAHAIDRGAIIRNVYKGQAEPIYGPVSPIYRWCAPVERLREVTPRTDPAAAVAGLAALGVVPGEPDADGKRWLTYEENGKRVPLEFEVRTNVTPEDVRRRTAEEVKAQLEGIGVRVKVVEERFGDMVARLDKTYDYEAAVMALEGSPDAATMRFFFESSGPMHFVNPYQKAPATAWEKQVDDLFRVYATSPDAAARDKALVDMQVAWSAAQPAFHLYNDRMMVAVRRDFEVNGLALTGRAADPVLERTVVENVRVRRLVAK
jgi:peptide/nickel transport system substrate-binding protein